MIPNNKPLKKVTEILNSEGPILSLYKSDGQFYLASFLKNGEGTIYYAVEKEDLIQYLNGSISIIDLYTKSEDFFVSKKNREGMQTFLKEDFAGKLQCGTDLYKDLQISMKIPNVLDSLDDQ